jgi:hypothetical protein
MGETIKQRDARRRRSLELRIKAFKILCNGEKPHCQCPGCTVDFIEFLQCDHVNGDGAAHRKANRLWNGADLLWRYVIEHPEERSDFQVLCRNCNGAKFTRKRCPLHGQSHVAEPRQVPIVKFDPTLQTLEA